jgi:predicted acylesterase/phospholipase RssA
MWERTAMKRPVSIAFQGGGAKVVVLLAAAEAISELIRDEQVEVVAVSGSSAGSIAALLLSAGVDFSQARKALKNNELEISQKFGPLSKRVMIFKAFEFLVRGKPIYSARLFNDLMSKVLWECGIDINKNI